jgi:mycothiol synthase
MTTNEPRQTNGARSRTLDLAFRPLDLERDLPGMVDLENRSHAAVGIEDRNTVADQRNWLSPTPHFNPDRDVTIVTLDGTLVAWGEVAWIDTRDELREYRLGGWVDPARERSGIGSSLLDWQEHRARELAASQETDRPLVFGTWIPEVRVGKRVLFEGRGYRPVRYFFDMIRPGLDEIEIPPLPDGIEIREADEAQDRRIWEADVEAFHDHWGGTDVSEERYQRDLLDPNRERSLWVVAWDGDEVAGGSINAIYPAENEHLDVPRGWLDSVFVRRRWRRRGLGAALVARSLVKLRERGMGAAMLGVDAENPTGALGLYERAGFEVHRRSTAYRKSMENGS